MKAIRTEEQTVAVTVVLEMTGEDASVLLEITHHVGGDPRGPRGAADRLRAALEEAGVTRSHSFAHPDIDGSIHFPHS